MKKCPFDPRQSPNHLEPRNCPRCGEPVVFGMFHLDHANPLTAQFLQHLQNRPSLPLQSGIANYRLASRDLARWNTVKDRYIAALATGAKRLKGNPK